MSAGAARVTRHPSPVGRLPSRMPRLVLTCLLALAAPPACAQTRPRAAPAPPPPRLIVFITVDQMRADYLDRFAGQYAGGLARLARGGAVFTSAYQDHAITETAPGHASTMSGRFPRSTGIVRNSAGVQDPQAPLVGGGGDAASPFRFRGTVLVDWLRMKDPRTRALSISRKDRAAIFPLGRAKQSVFWYAPGTGRFTTSTYYADTLPTWVQRVNARRVPMTLAGRAWTPLLPDTAYPEPDSESVESNGKDFTFPHVLPADPGQAASALVEFPWMDQLTLDVALEGLTALGLGRGPQTDVLAVSLSTTDAVGHRYGAGSRELHDQLLRLDRSLGAFLDSLYRLRDSATVAVVLTADHGMPAPTAADPRRPQSAPRHVDLSPVVAPAAAALARAGVDGSAFVFEDGVLLLDRDALRRARVDADSLVDAIARAARRVPGVLSADRWRDLVARDTVRDAIARRWLHMFPPDLPVALVVTLEPYAVFGGSAFTHGSPHDYDAHVPLVFYGPWFRPGRYAAFARVVDAAPTLARIAAVRPTEPLDGRVLMEALR